MINQLKQDKTLKLILDDSFGGIIYDLANKNKYETKELLNKYNKLSPREKESLGGIVSGAINFII